MSSRLLNVQEWQQLAVQAEFNPENLASLCGLSERQVQRIFKRRFRKTPSRWLRELQCCLAKRLVSEGYRTKAIAEELSFTSDSHFCREFKKAFGSSPQTFAPVGLERKMSLIDNNVGNRQSITLENYARGSHDTQPG